MEWKNALYLPQKTVLTGEKGKFVYTINSDKTVSPKPITIGEWIDQNIIIDQGVELGESVVSDGLPKLKPGSQVIPQATKN